MKKIIKCSDCHKNYSIIIGSQKESNGAFVKNYTNGTKANLKRCYKCKRANARANWCNNKPSYLKYEKTPSGFLMRKYRNMKSRVLGIQYKKAHLYKGIDLLSKEDFYEWAKSTDEFDKMYNAWVASGFNRGLCPTVDRIDSSKGYVKENMRWLTHSENSRLGTLSKNDSIRKIRESKSHLS